MFTLLGVNMCWLNFHNWRYFGHAQRECRCCGRREWYNRDTDSWMRAR